jgi:acylglycerol lipase
MIAMGAMHSTLLGTGLRIGRRGAVLGAAALAGCAGDAPATNYPPRVTREDGAFVMRDGARLPYRLWQPNAKPRAAMLALHGFNDSRDAWEIPAPSFSGGGIALYSPDQRGFGEAPGRGLWAGGDVMADDAAEMLRQLGRRHPGMPLFAMGESMGGAVLMHMATRPHAPALAGTVLVAPAVWGRARMNVLLRSSLWLAATLVPDMEVSRPPAIVRVRASDNLDALIALSRDPLTVKSTRFDTLRGLVDLMDDALAAAPHFTPPSLLLYGAKDDLVPKPATLATWQAIPPGAARFAYYPNGYHLLMRDLDRAAPVGDTIAWIRDRSASLPSGADVNATNWLAGGAA